MIIRDLVRGLQPIHETTARFEHGGKQCARDISRIYDELTGLLIDLLDEDDDGDAE